MKEPHLSPTWSGRSPAVESSRGLRGELGPPLDAEVVELALLLPAREAAALEAAAWQRGLTTGQAIRRLIRGFLGGAFDGRGRSPSEIPGGRCSLP